MIQLCIKSNKDIIPFDFLYFIASKFNFHYGHGYESHGMGMSNLKEGAQDLYSGAVLSEFHDYQYTDIPWIQWWLVHIGQTALKS